MIAVRPRTKGQISDSRWSRYGVRSVRLRGPRGQVRYRVRFSDGSTLSAGLFGGYIEAIRHAHASAVKRQRLDSLRTPRVGSERWLWRAGDLEELVAQPPAEADRKVASVRREVVAADRELAEAERELAAAEHDLLELGPGRFTESRIDALRDDASDLGIARRMWTRLWTGGSVA